VGGAQVPKDDELPDGLKALSRRQAHELTDSRWDYDVERLLKSVESIGIRSRSPSDYAAKRQRLKLCGWVLGVATLLVGMISVADEYSLWQRTFNMARLAVGERADSATMQQFEAELRRERREREEAETEATLERQKRLQAEEGAERERARSQQDAEVERASRNDELHGDIVVSWIYEGAVHEATISLNGSSGYAQVAVQDALGLGIFYEVEQDLYLEERNGKEFYVGSGVRVLGNHNDFGVATAYSPDIFRIERLGGGRWTINEVGVHWGLFVRAKARPRF
jgi:hypothetical protein